LNKLNELTEIHTTLKHEVESLQQQLKTKQSEQRHYKTELKSLQYESGLIHTQLEEFKTIQSQFFRQIILQDKSLMTFLGEDNNDHLVNRLNQTNFKEFLQQFLNCIHSGSTKTK